MPRKIAGITDAAVEDATGKGWAEWLAVLDEADATDLDHKEIVAVLDNAGVENPWWHQQLAVGYEQERGMREVGETATAGFEIGVQRTLPVGPDELWRLLTSAEGVYVWLGEARGVTFEPGEPYRTADGTTGEIRTVSSGERVRLTWQPEGWEKPSTLQLTLTCPRNTDERTTLRVHQEKLASGEQREEMGEHWRGVLDRIEALVTETAS